MIFGTKYGETGFLVQQALPSCNKITVKTDIYAEKSLPFCDETIVTEQVGNR
jgi:hypothetical protein